MYIHFIVQWILDGKPLSALCVIDVFLQLSGIKKKKLGVGKIFFF